jgi:flagellar assembly protein FliH
MSDPATMAYAGDRRMSAHLFNEDFDHPPPAEPPPEPEIIEPAYSVAEIEAARAEAWRDGHDTAVADALASDSAAAVEALRLIAAQLAEARHEITSIGEAAADSLARMTMAALAAALPAMCAAHGDVELKAIIRTLLPALHQEPKVVIRVEPGMALSLEQEIDRLDPDLLPHVQIIPTETVASGDIRVAWRGGGAVRDSAALWRQIEDILMPAGLLATPFGTPAEPGRSDPRGFAGSDAAAAARELASRRALLAEPAAFQNPAAQPAASRQTLAEPTAFRHTVEEPEHVE